MGIYIHVPHHEFTLPFPSFFPFLPSFSPFFFFLGVRQDGPHAAQPLVATDHRPQHCRLHDREEQRRSDVQGHESHQQLRTYPRSAVRVVHVPVLRTRPRPSRSWYVGFHSLECMCVQACLCFACARECVRTRVRELGLVCVCL